MKKVSILLIIVSVLGCTHRGKITPTLNQITEIKYFEDNLSYYIGDGTFAGNLPNHSKFCFIDTVGKFNIGDRVLMTK
jgi:hypothetical protein